MKKFITIITAAIIATPAVALTIDGAPRIQDHYKDITRKVPVTETVCTDRQVPVRKESFSTGKAVIGGIIGGIIGHNLGGKNNRHITASFGTLAGSVIGGSENEVQGYRTQTNCENQTSYHSQTETVYSHSTITFTEDGQTYRLNFEKNRHRTR